MGKPLRVIGSRNYPFWPLWPAQREARARARSVSAEMHSGFIPLRKAMPAAFRFLAYGVGEPGAVDEYLRTTADDPLARDWVRAAWLEEEVIASSEAGIQSASWTGMAGLKKTGECYRGI